MDHDPIGDCLSLNSLRRWLSAAGKSTLWDISTWAGTHWTGWDFLDVPPELLQDCKIFHSKLNGIAPTHRCKRDSRGWGTLVAGYTVAQGYAMLILRPHVPPDLAPWAAIWRLHSLPKIDMFCWILCHKKILTDDKLQKHGFYGSSRCPLCRESVECATHLMLN